MNMTESEHTYHVSVKTIDVPYYSYSYYSYYILSFLNVGVHIKFQTFNFNQHNAHDLSAWSFENRVTTREV